MCSGTVLQLGMICTKQRTDFFNLFWSRVHAVERPPYLLAASGHHGLHSVKPTILLVVINTIMLLRKPMQCTEHITYNNEKH